MTSKAGAVARKAVLTGAVGVVSGTAVASITGAEWSNLTFITQTAFWLIFKALFTHHSTGIMADDPSSQTWSIDKDDYELNEVIGE